MSEKKNKLLIATGVFPPDIGGPGTFAEKLANEFFKYGFEVAVAAYGDKERLDFAEASDKRYKIYYVGRRQNIIRRYIKYFRLIWKLSRAVNIIYAMDIISVGIPCALVKIFKPRLKLVFRLGGDFQWEKAAQAGYGNTLEQYYIDKKFGITEKLIYFLSNFALNRADFIIFNALILKDIYEKYRKINKEKIGIVKNVSLDIKTNLATARPKNYVNILFAGRLIAVRNLERLIDAFETIRKNNYFRKVVLEILGEGPEKEHLENYVKERKIDNDVIFLPKSSHDDLMNKINNSDIAALVSLTEINSNFISEALALNKPVVLTDRSESFYAGDKSKLIYYINPLDTDDIARGLNSALNDLFSGRITGAYSGGVSSGIREVIQSHLEIFRKIL